VAVVMHYNLKLLDIASVILRGP